ncbi:MAG: endonuclease III [Parcubacteria group bacterium Athens0714_16]|nr:MAG: endonuclease III [Parcubacteria group bacterium Athens0714_16]
MMASKKFKERKNRAIKIAKVLNRLFIDEQGTSLGYKNNWELLVSVILSAQCTDKRVNMVTKKLFKKYKKLDDYVSAKKTEFEKDIKSTGYYKNKTKNILSAAKMIKIDFSGHIPNNMEDLLKIPGVGRKTANVVLNNVFNVVEGIVVDTHVRRLSIKFDLTDNKNPEKIEKDLMEILPKKYWNDFSFKLVRYGQEICGARKHDCKTHPLTKIYPRANTIWPRAK